MSHLAIPVHLMMLRWPNMIRFGIECEEIFMRNETKTLHIFYLRWPPAGPPLQSGGGGRVVGPHASARLREPLSLYSPVHFRYIADKSKMYLCIDAGTRYALFRLMPIHNPTIFPFKILTKLKTAEVSGIVLSGAEMWNNLPLSARSKFWALTSTSTIWKDTHLTL